MPPQPTKTIIHIMALDGIVNVNFLFTLALFIGLSLNSDNTLLTPTAAATTCAATTAAARRLVSFHVYSFSSFLFSSLIALGLKQGIRNTDRDDTGHVDLTLLRVGILGSGFGSVFGCVFLTMALLEFVQIKLGVLACWGSYYSLAAAIPLVTLVPSALFIYIFIVFHAFTK